MSRKERVIRFTVGSAGRHRASTWRCWTPGGGKYDVYFAPRSIGGAYKLSLHESGAWQVGFTSDFKRSMAEQGRWKGGSRLTAQFAPPKEIGPGTLLAFRILVPGSAVSIDSATESLPDNLVWIPPPPNDRVVEVALLLTANGLNIDGWPGRRSLSTNLVGDFPLDSGEHLWLVHRQDCIPTISGGPASLSRFAPEPGIMEQLDSARAIVLINVDGEPAAFMECKFEDKRI